MSDKTTQFVFVSHGGRSFPLGATPDRDGVNFALFSGHATAVELCLFTVRGSGYEESERFVLRDVTDGVWHGFVRGAGPGTLYGYRVYGDDQSFDPKLLAIDPYARQLFEDPNAERYRSGGGPPAVVTPARPDFDWGDDRRPETPWARTVIYEGHVKGLTAGDAEVPEQERGRYGGVASDAMIEHYRNLGVTAVELLPVQQHIDEPHLVERALTNYWGYATIAYFVPNLRYAGSGAGAVREFQTMVRRLHAAGIEVILDVVLNHSGEGPRTDPGRSFRLIDDLSYYHTVAQQERYYDASGCGNTLRLSHPRVLQFALDCLRYWAETFHVDGFRFDLAACLGRRGEYDGFRFDPTASFFAAIAQDPVLSPLKLIAEPWDLGDAGHQTGNFPAPFFEWNDRYRDAVRRFWRGDEIPLHETAARLAGSGDVFPRRLSSGVHTGINYVTSHDGFTLRDLVTYNHKHNEANGEDNRDGHEENLSYNFGIEGPAEDNLEVQELRRRQMRNFMATLFLSRGVLMFPAGDEHGRTQGGNNNAYCQDNAMTWLDRNLNTSGREFQAFVSDLSRLRREQRAVREFVLHGDAGLAGENVCWLTPSGEEPGHDDWAHTRRCFGALFFPDGAFVTNDGQTTLLVLWNTSAEEIMFRLPAHIKTNTVSEEISAWVRLFDTVHAGFDRARHARPGGDGYRLQPRSMAVFVPEQSGASGA